MYIHSARSLLFTKSLLLLIASATTGSAALAQTDPASRDALCANDRGAITQLSVALGQSPLWDDARIVRARESLAKLRASRSTLLRLTKRLNDAKQSAANAAAFDKSGEANFWRRDAVDVRAAVDTEKTKAKALAAYAGVSCPGCTYSVLISKVEAAINAAMSARSQAFQVQQQIASYRAIMRAQSCSE